MVAPDDEGKVPVIAIDGPGGSGKGTISHMLADYLGWHLLDSGALYRVVGQACVIEDVSWEDEPAVAAVARHLDVSFRLADNGEVMVSYKGIDISGAEGDPVMATAAGEVVYAGSAIAGYGLMLIIH